MSAAKINERRQSVFAEYKQDVKGLRSEKESELLDWDMKDSVYTWNTANVSQDLDKVEILNMENMKHQLFTEPESEKSGMTSD